MNPTGSIPNTSQIWHLKPLVRFKRAPIVPRSIIRLTEERARGAKSVFHFDVQGSVAKSTHAGIPWLRFIRQHLQGRVHFWPFDGWDIPVGRSAIAEVYPALWSNGIAAEGRDPHQHDAFSIATWLARADRDGSLPDFLKPALTPPERAIAQVEGWILGVA